VGGARPPAAAHRSARRERTSPLVTTITKIADVVPFPVRLLLGLMLSLSLALATRTRLAAVSARRLERQREQLLEDVGLLQAALLPIPPARLGLVGTSVAYRPADGPGAGGDFYDVFALEDGKVAVILGDISGHGRQALPHTALVRFTLRAYLEAGLSPWVAVRTAGSVLDHQLGGSFATVVVATYHPRERTLVYACAGHPPPLVIDSSGRRDRLQDDQPDPASPVGAITPVTVCASPPVGAGMRTGSRQTTVVVPGEAQVCFYTDGVTEARTGGELFGAQRLARALDDLGPGASASRLLERVAAATDTHRDDMAACVLNIAGGDATPAVSMEELELDRETPSRERAEQLLRACGVPESDVAEPIDAARAAAGHAGTAVIEVHLGDGRPLVKLRHENLAHLPVAPVRPRAFAGAMP
jgi:serine phosphatase RsbU (regulator of sigma subunit)